MTHRIVLTFISILLPLSLMAAEPDTEPKKAAETEQLSYQFGLLLGSRFTNTVEELEFAKFLQGFKAGYNREADPQELNVAMQQFQAYQLARQAQLAEQALVTGNAFLAKNGQRKGVTTTASGLQYEVIKAGQGTKPQATDRVTVHYRGTLINGTEFDSSYSRGEPASFALNGVIKGWTEGVQLMQPGAIYKFYIPANLAYGEKGAGNNIGPNETLIFEVELIKVGT